MLERLYLSSGVGAAVCHPGGAGGGIWGEGDPGISAQTTAFVARIWISGGKCMDG